MILLIDNYDSFTYNLAHYLGAWGAEVVVRRNDALTAADALALKASHIVLSPGPCGPEQAGICLDLIKLASEAGMPLLGVCLGHQSIGHMLRLQVELQHRRFAHSRFVPGGFPDQHHLGFLHFVDRFDLLLDLARQ